MRPQWFSEPKVTQEENVQPTTSEFQPIPYDTMWADDIHWMPLMIAGKHFVGRADFYETPSGKLEMKKWWFGVPDSS